MEKPYGIKDLGDKLKDRGLDLAEDAAGIVAEEVLGWLKESAIASENKYDDMLVAAIPLFEGELKKQIDKIDGKNDL